MSRLDRIAAGATMGTLRHVARMIALERKRTRHTEDDYLDGLDFAAEIVADEIDRIATFAERGPRHIHVTIPARMMNAYRYARGVAWWKR